MQMLHSRMRVMMTAIVSLTTMMTRHLMMDPDSIETIHHIFESLLTALLSLVVLANSNCFVSNVSKQNFWSIGGNQFWIWRPKFNRESHLTQLSICSTHPCNFLSFLAELSKFLLDFSQSDWVQDESSWIFSWVIFWWIPSVHSDLKLIHFWS